MGSEHHIRRWESGALAHAVTDPFGQGPVPWLRGNVTYFDDTGHVVPWYVEPGPPEPDPPAKGGRTGTRARVPAPRTAPGGPRSADDVRRQIKGFTAAGAAAPGESIDFHITVDPPQEFGVDIYRIGHYSGDGAAKITTSPRL
ncbi:phosphoribosylamine--glycine ligase, partial [Streptomyces sp. MB09-02B]|nr:phosphoribosylamine--glycine ligase [Streptomyces sp. MB09-02B]